MHARYRARARDERLSATANLRLRCIDHAQSRNRRIISLYVSEQRRLKRRVSQFVDTQRSEQRVGTNTLDELSPSGDYARLRTPKQLVSTDADYVNTGAQTLVQSIFALDAGTREIYQQTVTEIFHYRNSAAAA